MSERVTGTEIAKVAPRDRCAWGAVCAEALTRLYSPYFQKRFDVETAFSLVWHYITTDSIDVAGAKRYLRKCARIGASDEAYAYGLPNGMLASLVGELLYPTGASVVECVGFCARLYPQILFFKHGIDDRMANINEKHIRALMAEYDRFTRSVLDLVTRRQGSHQRDEYAARFALDASAFTLPKKLFVARPSPTGRTTASVPEYEVIR
jgi:hypothetical protein